MTPLLLALALVVLTEVDSVGTAQPQLGLRRIQPRPVPLVMARARDSVPPPSVVVEGNGVASMRIRLEPPPVPDSPAYEEWMSLGPRGRWSEGTAAKWGMDRESHRLRVTYGSCERGWSMVIEDVVTGRADTRRVAGAYVLYSGDDIMNQLWVALQNTPRVFGYNLPDPPIVWRSPTSFAWLTPADTLIVERMAGSDFRLTLRAWVR